MGAFELTVLVITRLSNRARLKTQEAPAESRDTARLYQAARQVLLLDCSDDPGNPAESPWKKVDLILLDVKMPGLNGLEACRAMRARSDVRLTVRDRAEDKIQALDSGANGYVTTTFDVNDLPARIRATLPRAPVSAFGETRVLRLPDREVSFRDRQVRANGCVSRLTATELDLLYYFLTHPNEVLPHDKLYEQSGERIMVTRSST